MQCLLPHLPQELQTPPKGQTALAFVSGTANPTGACDSNAGQILLPTTEEVLSDNSAGKQASVRRIQEEEIRVEPEVFWPTESSELDVSVPCCNANDDDDISHVSPQVSSSTPCNVIEKVSETLEKKKEMSVKSSQSTEKCDSDMEFFKSLLSDVRTLPDSKKMIFKIKTLELLNQLLYIQDNSDDNFNKTT